MKINAALILFLALFGGFLGRWHGIKIGFEVPRSIKNFVCSYPFGVAAIGITHNQYIACVCFLMSLAGIATGDGRGISLTQPLRGSPEFFEFLTLWAVQKIPLYWYKALLLMTNGLIICSGPVIAFCIVGQFSNAALAALGGALKPVGYIIGWKIYPEGQGRGIKYLNEATAIGEFFSGVFQLGFLSLAMALS